MKMNEEFDIIEDDSTIHDEFLNTLKDYMEFLGLCEKLVLEEETDKN